MSELSRKSCVPCSGGVPPLPREEEERLLAELANGWTVVDHHHLSKSFSFPDFRRALDFANRAGEVAEREFHHPDLLVSWGRVEVTIWTHKIDGLTESDFVLAAKIEQVSGDEAAG